MAANASVRTRHHVDKFVGYIHRFHASNTKTRRWRKLGVAALRIHLHAIGVFCFLEKKREQTRKVNRFTLVDLVV